MAMNGHSKFMRTSIHGRRFGLDDYDALTGQLGSRNGQETITSASTLNPTGTSLLNGSTAMVCELTPPREDLVGMKKRVIAISTSAQAQLFKLTAGNFLVNGARSANTCSLTTQGAAVDLEYISTALVAVLSYVVGSTGADIIEFTTST